MEAPSQEPRMPRRALVLINHKARSGQSDPQEMLDRLVAGGLELLDGQFVSGDADTLIREDGPRADVIILGGGDGTIHHALPALLEVQRPVGLIPLGTANDLARTLGLPTDPLLACDVIAHGRLQPMDVGFVNNRPFVNVASLGLAVEVTRRLTRGAKSRWGVLAYAWAALGAWLHGRPFSAELSCDGQHFATRTWQITVGNGRSYGGGLTIHEDARIDDGRFDLYSLEVTQGWHLFGLIPALWRGTLDPISTVRTMQGRQIEIRTRKRRRAITADGELVGKTPAVFRMKPAALQVCVPPAITPADFATPSLPPGFV
jgi:diacylglycerol kinase (ATP)